MQMQMMVVHNFIFPFSSFDYFINVIDTRDEKVNKDPIMLSLQFIIYSMMFFLFGELRI